MWEVLRIRMPLKKACMFESSFQSFACNLDPGIVKATISVPYTIVDRVYVTGSSWTKPLCILSSQFRLRLCIIEHH